MIEIENLTKDYYGEKVVKNLTLTVKKGSVFGFLGPNGAGKTTTMKMIVGLTRPSSGSILIGGKPAEDILAREKFGFMPEDPYFYDHLSGLEFLRFCGQLFSGSYAKKSDDYIKILATVGIAGAKDYFINTYSKGMKQRLGFAQAIVNDPEYVFLDEPLDGLDPIGRREIKQIIKNLRKEGKTVFFNSHILSDVEEICDEIGILHRGELIYSGKVADFCRGIPLEERFVEVIESKNGR